MKNIKYSYYILPSLVVSAALFMGGSQVLAFDGQGFGSSRGMGYKDPEARHEQMINLTQEQRDALRKDRQDQRDQRMAEKFTQLENAGFDTSALKEEKKNVDSAKDQMHEYMVSESEKYDKTTLEGRNAFRESTSSVRSSIKDKMESFRDQMRSALQKYGLFLGK